MIHTNTDCIDILIWLTQKNKQKQSCPVVRRNRLAKEKNKQVGENGNENKQANVDQENVCETLYSFCFWVWFAAFFYVVVTESWFDKK